MILILYPPINWIPLLQYVTDFQVVTAATATSNLKAIEFQSSLKWIVQLHGLWVRVNFLLVELSVCNGPPDSMEVCLIEIGPHKDLAALIQGQRHGAKKKETGF